MYGQTLFIWTAYGTHKKVFGLWNIWITYGVIVNEKKI